MPGSSASETCAQECIEVAVLERSPTLAYLLTKRLIRGLGRSDPSKLTASSHVAKERVLGKPKAPQGDY